MNILLLSKLAWRYVFGKRRANATTILSRISMVAIAVASAAMIILFSVFNGFEALVKDLYKAFYPDLKISVVKGKFFNLQDLDIKYIANLKGVAALSFIIEDNVLAKEDNLSVNSKDNQKMLTPTLKGIDKYYFKVNDIHKYLLYGGADSVSEGNPNTALLGKNILLDLGADVNNVFSFILLYYPNPTVTNPEADPANAYQTLRLHPSGAFKVEEEFDNKYILAPFSLAQKLFHEEGKYSSIEIKAAPEYLDELKKQIQLHLGTNYEVATRYEQNKTIYMVMNAEKWAVYAILLLVLIIASFNMVGALSMLVLEKQKDIAILKAMGMKHTEIRVLFLMEGMLWSLSGGIIGIILGCSICFLQLQFKIIKLKGFLIDSYPVKMELTDILLVVVTIICVGLFAAIYPAVKAAKTFDVTLKTA